MHYTEVTLKFQHVREITENIMHCESNKLFIGINIPYETYVLFTHNKQNYYLNSFERMSDIQIHHVLIQ